MKKLLFFFAIALTTTHGYAQEQGDIRIQAGSDYGYRSELFGVNLGGEYFVDKRTSFAPNFTIYLPEYGGASSLNLDLRYYFTEGTLQWYGLAGFTNNWLTVEFTDGSRRTSGRQGANIGAGGVLKFAERFAFNPEIKLQAQNRGQGVFRLGMVYFVN
ncbi:hypothetical protein [Lunatibacter salilacus]|uniref:hypothetical protein n=1 Tax=Lunatibacter salilacus TaxID=2483804 RepID=UPI00131C352C|nr:hypothetical protein [Lunatibacter salilacus]